MGNTVSTHTLNNQDIDTILQFLDQIITKTAILKTLQNVDTNRCPNVDSTNVY